MNQLIVIEYWEKLDIELENRWDANGKNLPESWLDWVSVPSFISGDCSDFWENSFSWLNSCCGVDDGK